MSSPLAALLAISAIWPFGHRDRDDQDSAGTIKTLEHGVVEIDRSAPIDGGEAKAMESYRLFLDLASDDALLRDVDCEQPATPIHRCHTTPPNSNTSGTSIPNCAMVG